ncbi:FAD-dependent oxidoreductase [Variovorax sp. HW608]|uniref:FAD-dependent oxidoreductase n=1 Tax=Variovorax sp. HW608 TaxID=1034889 RepID=UPI0012FD2F9F|nr:FAD-dependent oxidoreductase [Variovorax sp. HW608]
MGKQDRVIVVGAGPVGLLTALKLARAGVEVRVIEALPSLHQSRLDCGGRGCIRT